MRVIFDFDLSFKTNTASKFAAQQRGWREWRRDLWRHAGPSGDLLLRMPTQLHSLSENMRAPAWLLALALQLQELPGSLPSHYAVSLVGGAHVRYHIRKHFEGVGKSFFLLVCFCLFSFRRTPKVSFFNFIMHADISFLRLTADTNGKLRLFAWNAAHGAWLSDRYLTWQNVQPDKTF